MAGISRACYYRGLSAPRWRQGWTTLDGRIEDISDSAVTLVEDLIEQAILLLDEDPSLNPARDMLLWVLAAAAGWERAQPDAANYDHVDMPSPQSQKVLLREEANLRGRSARRHPRRD